VITRQTQQAVRCAVVDSADLLRNALALALAREPDIEVVWHAPDVPTARTNMSRTDTDVVVVSTTVAAGVRALRSPHGQRSAECRVLVLSEVDDLDLTVNAITDGAAGCIAKNVPFGEFAEAVRRVGHGDLYVPPRLLRPLICRLVAERAPRDDALVSRYLKLSAREREVLAMLVNGHDQSAIASALVLSMNTVRTHIQNILDGLGVHSRVEAVNLVSRHRLTERFDAFPAEPAAANGSSPVRVAPS
jgi:DNA-binding NarL/FixJ family response regulator